MKKWTDRIGVLGLGMFALASVWQTAPGYIGLAICLPSALLALWHQRGRPPDITGVLMVVVAGWLLFRYALQRWFGIAEPGLVDEWGTTFDWLMILIFGLLAGMPCSDAVRRVKQLWLLAMLGFALGVISYLYARGPMVLWSAERLRFHLDRPLGIGLYAACFVIMLIATLPRWWAIEGRLRWPARIGGLAVTALFVQVVISTQNRSIFLAAAVVAAGAIAHRAVRMLRRDRGTLRHWRGFAAAMVGVAILVGLSAEPIMHRLDAEREVIATIASRGLEAAPVSSAGVRLHLWQYAAERFADAPLIGHGFGDIAAIIDRDLRPGAALASGEYYDHVHNTYLQALWYQGLVGTVLWGALLALLLRDALRAAAKDPRRRALMPAIWGVLVLTAVWAFFDYRLSHPDMRFFTILLLLSLRLLGQAGRPAQPMPVPAGAAHA